MCDLGCTLHCFVGVGKSSLVHLVCHKEVLPHPTWTVGCTVEVKVREVNISATGLFLGTALSDRNPLLHGRC